MKKLVEPSLIRANNDGRYIVFLGDNKAPPPADCRLMVESMYQKLKLTYDTYHGNVPSRCVESFHNGLIKDGLDTFCSICGMKLK